MGLLGMMARTAVVAGTATAVSGRVARRQQHKWQQKADAQAYQEQQAAPQEQAPQPQYAAGARRSTSNRSDRSTAAAAVPAAAAAPRAARRRVDGCGRRIQRLAALKEQGILSEARVHRGQEQTARHLTLASPAASPGRLGPDESRQASAGITSRSKSSRPEVS